MYVYCSKILLNHSLNVPYHGHILVIEPAILGQLIGPHLPHSLVWTLFIGFIISILYIPFILSLSGIYVVSICCMFLENLITVHTLFHLHLNFPMIELLHLKIENNNNFPTVPGKKIFTVFKTKFDRCSD